MEIMACQYQFLQEALHGYEKTGISLIAYDGKVFKPAGLGDDVGIYDFLPKLAHGMGISIDQSINLFLGGMFTVSFCLGIIGLFLLLKKWNVRILALANLMFLAFVSFMAGGIYIALSSATIAVVPLFLYFVKRGKPDRMFMLFNLITGIGLGLAHHVRIHSGTGVIIFMVIVLLYLQIHWKRKAILLMLIVIGVSIPAIYFDRLLEQRDAYLKKTYSTFERPPRQHVFWHSVYIGFGFLGNEYGIRYKDEVAIKKVRSVSPKAAYLSEEYEMILKKEVYKLIKAHPLFTATTIFAKLGVICLYLFAFANVGLIAVAFHVKSWRLEVAFWSAMMFNSLFGILVVPDYRYLMGFLAFAALYGIMSLNQTVEQGGFRRMRALLKRSGEES